MQEGNRYQKVPIGSQALWAQELARVAACLDPEDLPSADARPLCGQQIPSIQLACAALTMMRAEKRMHQHKVVARAIASVTAL